MSDPAHVAIVFEDDPELMERLVVELPVWASRRPGAEALVDRLRADDSLDASRFTIFNFDEGGDIEDKVLDLIHDVDLHHGSSGGHPPLGRLDVYGIGLTPPMITMLEKFGLVSVQATPHGFSAAAPAA